MKDKASTISMQIQSKTANRKIYLDIVRIFAIFLVLFTHTGKSGPKLYTICEGQIEQILYLVLDCFRTINNPLLFMVSGALLLGKNESVKTIFRKRVVRFVIVLFVFSIFQSIYKGHLGEQATWMGFIQIIKNIIQNPIKSSYWYLYSYISFLVMLPFMRAIAQKMDFSQFIYMIICVIIVKDFFVILKPVMGLEHINFSIFLNGFNTFYPLLGYYIDKNWEEIQNKYNFAYRMSIVCGIVGLFVAVTLSLYSYRITLEWSETYIGLFYSLTAVAVFVSIKKLCAYLKNKNAELYDKISNVSSFMGKSVFGLYLLEEQFMSVTRIVFTISNKLLPTLLADWIWIITTMAVGSIVIGYAKKMPIIKNLL